MRTFRIPVYWQMAGHIEIEAHSIEEALKEFDRDIDEYDLPSESIYITDSFTRESDEFCIESSI